MLFCLQGTITFPDVSQDFFFAYADVDGVCGFPQHGLCHSWQVGPVSRMLRQHFLKQGDQKVLSVRIKRLRVAARLKLS